MFVQFGLVGLGCVRCFNGVNERWFNKAVKESLACC